MVIDNRRYWNMERFTHYWRNK